MATLAAVILLAAGCRSDQGLPGSRESAASASESASDFLASVAGEPAEFTPVHGDDLVAVTAAALPDRVSIGEVREAARAGSDHALGERFAMLVAVFATDSRHQVAPEDLLSLASSRMPRPNAEYLAQDQVAQWLSGSDRRIDPKVSSWLRSDVTSDSPPVVRTQMNSYVRTDLDTGDGTYSLWARFRVDVVWEEGEWKVTSFDNASGAESVEPSRQELKYYFYGGSGWRRVPAGT